MEIPKIIYENALKSECAASDLKKSLEVEFHKSSLYTSEYSSLFPFLPLIISKKEHEQIKKTSEMFGKIMDKTVGLVFEKKAGKYLRMYKTLWEWINRESNEFRETNNVTFGRINGIFNKDGVIKYFEFNSDPQGLLLAEELLAIYGRSHHLTEIFESLNISFFNKTKAAFTRFFEKYRKQAEFTKNKDNLAIIHVNDNYGYILYDKVLKDKGYNVYLVKPEDFKFDGKSLEANGTEFKFVILTSPINRMLSPRSMTPVIEACFAGKVKILDFLRSSIASEKSLLALISDPRNHKFYTTPEISFIKKHIPWTRIIRHERTTDIEGNDVDLIEYILANKDRLVLKKTNSFIGGQVGAAYDMNYLDWKTLISWILSSKEYWVAQEKIEFSSSERYDLENDKITLKKFYWCVNPFLLNNKYQTCYARTSIDHIVNTDSSATETLVGFVQK